jgi:hypothetical protein
MRAIETQNLTIKHVALMGALVLTAGCSKFSSESRALAEAGKQWQMVDRYCVDCHNEAEAAGELVLERLGPEHVAGNAATFEKVVRKLRGHLMPPPKEPRPDDGELYSFVSWLENNLDEAAAQRTPEQIALHRLNRKEYANAVRDLLALDIDVVALLPQDEQAGGFDNIASALQVSDTC